MFNNGALDIVIGLVFIYLLYSLLATIIQEIIAAWLSFRAKYLEKAIMRMLDNDAAKGVPAKAPGFRSVFFINQLSDQQKSKNKFIVFKPGI